VLACHDITEAHRLDLRLRDQFAKSARAIESLRAMAQRMLPASRRESFKQEGDLEVLSEALSELTGLGLTISRRLALRRGRTGAMARAGI